MSSMKLVVAFALVAIGAAAAPPTHTYFKPGDAPKCWMHNGRTIVHYSSKLHRSFKCTHNAQKTKCTCAFEHPTHAKGSCKQFTHEKIHTIDGDCSESGRNPINGGWSQWSSYGSCSKTCGTGAHTRTRTCSNPAPKYGGKQCTGSARETHSCHVQTCAPVWTSWSSWSGCNKKCGGGKQARQRNCVPYGSSTSAPGAPAAPVVPRPPPYDRTFRKTWCVDHYVRVRYDNNGDVFLGGVEPSNRLHTGRGDCGGHPQGWWKVTNFDPSLANGRIEVKVIGGNHCGTHNGCGMSHSFAPSRSTQWDMKHCIFGCGGAQKPTIQIRVRAFDNRRRLVAQVPQKKLTCAGPRIQEQSCNRQSCRYDHTFEKTWCVDHKVRVRYDNDGSVYVGGVEPSNRLHTGRGDCGGHPQGWWKATNFGRGFANAKISINVAGGNHCGTHNGCGMTHQFAPSISTSWDMNNCIFSCGGAQKPHLRIRVQAWN